MLNQTNVGKEWHTMEQLENGIKTIVWEDFRTDNLPFSQGSCLKTVVKECNIPIKKIEKMCLHGYIKSDTIANDETHAFYGLIVNYSNGRAIIYISDNGCEARPVAVDFTPKFELVENKQIASILK